MRLWRLKSLLRGEDGVGKTALPVGEFFHPVSLSALLILVANDWWWKTAYPGAITGKLSDVAGLTFFPLLLTAIADLFLYGLFRIGLELDFSLRRWKVVLTCAATASVFGCLKLLPSFNAAAVDLARSAGLGTQIVMDPTDLFTLPALLLPILVSREEIARLPLGRLEFLLSSSRPPEPALADLIACGADARLVGHLAATIADHRSAPSESSTQALIDAVKNLREPEYS